LILTRLFLTVGAAPHPPVGTFSPFLRQAQDGEKTALPLSTALILQRRRLAKSLMKAPLSPS
jgi:hypothetical protein